MGELRLEGARLVGDGCTSSVGRAHAQLQVPMLARLESKHVVLAFHNQPERDRLHTARRAAAWQLAPKYRRQSEAHEVVDRLARLLRAHQRYVDAPRRRQSIRDRLLRNLRERDPMHGHIVGQERTIAQRLVHVPRDRLAFAVGVRRQVERARVPHRRSQVLQDAPRARHELKVHCEALRGPHRVGLGWERAHVAVARQHDAARARKLGDRCALGRRLDDHHYRPFGPRPLADRRITSRGRRLGRGLLWSVGPSRWHMRTLRHQPREQLVLAAAARQAALHELLLELRHRHAEEVDIRSSHEHSPEAATVQAGRLCARAKMPKRPDGECGHCVQPGHQKDAGRAHRSP